MSAEKCENNKVIDVQKIVVTGGKGGTGKSLIATNLAYLFQMSGKKVLLVDADVENPNIELLLGTNAEHSETIQRMNSPVTIFQPIFDPQKCIKCGFCRDKCYKHAILQFNSSLPEIMEHLCSGCTTCIRICPENAILKGERKIGKINFIKNYTERIDLLIGELIPQEAMSIAVISALLKKIKELSQQNNYDIVIIDSSPGAHCDVEMLLEHADLPLCVTEPTSFGEHDLFRILELIKIVHQKSNLKKSAIIINRSTISDYKDPIIRLATQFNAPIIGEIPLDPVVIENYAKGTPFVVDKREFLAKNKLINIFSKIQTILMEEKDHDAIRTLNC